MNTKTLQVSEKTARQLYPSTTEDMKKILEDTFGKAFFSQDIKDRIKSFDDVLNELSVHNIFGVKELLDYSGSDKDMKGALAMLKISLIAKALNEGWEPDWDNSGQPKYYPWFKYGGAGVGFAYSGCADGHSISSVGSRLCFKTSDLAIYAAKQFKDIYNEFLIIK